MSLSNLIKNEQGNISLLVTLISFGVLLVMTVLGVFVNGFLTSSQLNNSADRIALGAATNLISKPENVCDVAMELAANNEVELQFCEVTDDEVLLRVRSDKQIQSWLDRWQQIGMARAGIDYVFD